MTEQASPDILARLSAAGADLLKAKAELEAAQDAATRAEAKVNDLEQKLIPDLMEEAGVDSFTTKDGLRIALTKNVRTNTKSPELHAWLREIGSGGLIKSVVTVPFTKGGDEAARGLVAELAGREIASDFTQDVAWNSLQTLVRDRLKDGEEVPLERLNIHLMPAVKVTLPRK
jgi:hypothetical protein